jgi:hypothetical protein
MGREDRGVRGALSTGVVLALSGIASLTNATQLAVTRSLPSAAGPGTRRPL